jgi:hypothetical protein
MKSFFTFGALAALCQSAYGLESGVYSIASADSNSLVLTDEAPNKPLAFTRQNQDPAQEWHFDAADGGYFEITSDLGSYINCETTGDKICYPGEQPQAFKPEFQGDKKYELVEQGSGLFLRITKKGTLQLAEWDQSIDEQFRLISV